MKRFWIFKIPYLLFSFKARLGTAFWSPATTWILHVIIAFFIGKLLENNVYKRRMFPSVDGETLIFIELLYCSQLFDDLFSRKPILKGRWMNLVVVEKGFRLYMSICLLIALWLAILPVPLASKHNMMCRFSSEWYRKSFFLFVLYTVLHGSKIVLTFELSLADHQTFLERASWDIGYPIWITIESQLLTFKVGHKTEFPQVK